LVIDEDVKVNNSSAYIDQPFIVTVHDLIEGLVDVTTNANTSQHIISDVITGKGGGLVSVPVQLNDFTLIAFCFRSQHFMGLLEPERRLRLKLWLNTSRDLFTSSVP